MLRNALVVECLLNFGNESFVKGRDDDRSCTVSKDKKGKRGRSEEG